MDVFTSRYFTIDDPVISHFTWQDVSWDFYKMHWWSRIYEYEWARNVCNAYFNDISSKSVIDIATGDQHPGIFMFKSLGFSRVVGTDILPLNKLKFCAIINDGIEYIQDNILDVKISDKFDCVSCISVLEHFNPDDQKVALKNIANMINDNGCILLTFDVPGYEGKTDVCLYENILQSLGFYFKGEVVEKDKIITTANSPIACSDLRRKQLSCYRLFASKREF